MQWLITVVNKNKMTMKDSIKPIVIVGGGFAGLFTALHLRHQKCSRPSSLPYFLIQLTLSKIYLIASDLYFTNVGKTKSQLSTD